MDRWEYKAVTSKEVGVSLFSAKKSAAKVEEFLNDLGRDRWEVIQFNFASFETGGILALLKRRRN